MWCKWSAKFGFLREWFVDLVMLMAMLMQVSGELRGELRSYPAKDALSIRCVWDGASALQV
jgi:hypothetical protein